MENFLNISDSIFNIFLKCRAFSNSWTSRKTESACDFRMFSIDILEYFRNVYIELF
jgi:hypothetical protein